MRRQEWLSNTGRMAVVIVGDECRCQSGGGTGMMVDNTVGARCSRGHCHQMTMGEGTSAPDDGTGEFASLSAMGGCRVTS